MTPGFPSDYESRVYAGVLGKVIGVYMGRPFEGWPKQRITERWGLVDRFVAADCQVLVAFAGRDWGWSRDSMKKIYHYLIRGVSEHFPATWKLF